MHSVIHSTFIITQMPPCVQPSWHLQGNEGQYDVCVGLMESKLFTCGHGQPVTEFITPGRRMGPMIMSLVSVSCPSRWWRWWWSGRNLVSLASSSCLLCLCVQLLCVQLRPGLAASETKTECGPRESAEPGDIRDAGSGSGSDTLLCSPGVRAQHSWHRAHPPVCSAHSRPDDKKINTNCGFYTFLK